MSCTTARHWQRRAPRGGPPAGWPRSYRAVIRSIDNELHVISPRLHQRANIATYGYSSQWQIFICSDAAENETNFKRQDDSYLSPSSRYVRGQYRPPRQPGSPNTAWKQAEPAAARGRARQCEPREADRVGRANGSGARRRSRPHRRRQRRSDVLERLGRPDGIAYQILCGVWSGESSRKRTMDSASRSDAAVSLFAYLLMSNVRRTSFPRYWLLAHLESAGGEPLGEWEGDAVERPQVRAPLRTGQRPQPG